MPIDPNIALQYRPPQFESPFQSIGALMQMRAQTAELALRQAQAEEARQRAIDVQAQADQRNRDLADANKIQEALADPAIAPKIAQGDFSAIQGQIQPKSVEALQTWHDTHQKALLANTKSQNEAAATNLSKIEDALTGLKGIDPADLPAASAQAISNLQAQKAFEYLPGGEIPKSLTDPKQIDTLLAGVGGLLGSTNKALAQQKEKAGIAETAARTAEMAAKTPGEAAESGIKQKELELMQNANASGSDAAIDARIDPKQFPEQNATAKAAYRLALSSSGSPKEAAAAAEKVAATVDEIRKQTAEIPGEVAKSVAVARATNPIIQQRELTVAAANRAAAEHVTAEGEYQKELQNFNTSAADATRLHNLISQAQGGNKAAPGLIPIAELRGFLNRINTVELRNVSSSAGAWADRVEGFLKGATEGQPIPPDVMRDMDNLANLQVEQAEQKHAGAVKAINTARRENFKPLKATDLGYQQAAPASVPAGKIAVISPEGIKGYINADKWDEAQKRGFRKQ